MSAPVCSCTVGQAEDSMDYWWFLLWSETKALAFPAAEPADRDDSIRGSECPALCSTCELLPKLGGTLCSALLTCVKIKIQASILSLIFSVTLKFAALSLHKGPEKDLCMYSRPPS